MRLLLDTATFLWTVLGDPQLSAAARTALADPANDPFLSAVSATEIAVKHGLGRLVLPQPPDIYIPRVRRAHQIEALPLSEEAALGLVRLLVDDPDDGHALVLLGELSEHDILYADADGHRFSIRYAEVFKVVRFRYD